MKITKSFALLVSLLSFSVCSTEKEITINAHHVKDGIYYLAGQGGNIGLSVGKDGVFMIDDQFAPLSKKIKAAIKTISASPVKFLINTHWHGDHVGGNQNFAHDGSVIVAHKNVRKRMSSKQFNKLFDRTTKASPETALPVITFSEEIEFHINGDTAQVVHLPHGHTDGDSIIWFKKSNVMHMGDLFFAGKFPFIDTSSGGSIDGIINAANWVLENATRNTQIIPGHGALSTMEDLLAYRNMLVEARKQVIQAMANNAPLKQVQEKKPLVNLAEKWGSGFIKQDVFVQIIFESLKSN